jgi:hypothetical protein
VSDLIDNMQVVARWPAHPDTDAEAFTGYYALLRWADANGWAVGALDRAAPVGILRTDGFVVAKWHNLAPSERRALDGMATWDGARPRTGPVVVYLRQPLTTAERERLPPEARPSAAPGAP